jgi:ABC-type ATPase with predicted acetyltransferase domain
MSSTKTDRLNTLCNVLKDVALAEQRRDKQSIYAVVDGDIWAAVGVLIDDSIVDYQLLSDPYQELSILQFERAEISSRIQELLLCMETIEGSSDKLTQAGIAKQVE